MGAGCGSEKELFSEKEEEKIVSASTSDDFEAVNLGFNESFWSPKEASPPQPQPEFTLDIVGLEPEPKKILHTENEGNCSSVIEDLSKGLSLKTQLSSLMNDMNKSVDVENLLWSLLGRLKQENQELKDRLNDILAQCEKEDSLLS